jgi:hypothetical protein
MNINPETIHALIAVSERLYDLVTNLVSEIEEQNIRIAKMKESLDEMARIVKDEH